MDHPHCANNIKVHSIIWVDFSIVQQDSQRDCLIIFSFSFFWHFFFGGEVIVCYLCASF